MGKRMKPEVTYSLESGTFAITGLNAEQIDACRDGLLRLIERKMAELAEGKGNGNDIDIDNLNEN